jgi:drug/metabolite transporter (DMT)-like permease
VSEEPSAGGTLVGIFLILCGLCLVLVGGGCALFWVAAMFGGGDGLAGNYGLGIPLLLVSLAALGAGAVMLRAVGKK